MTGRHLAKNFYHISKETLLVDLKWFSINRIAGTCDVMREDLDQSSNIVIYQSDPQDVTTMLR